MGRDSALRCPRVRQLPDASLPFQAAEFERILRLFNFCSNVAADLIFLGIMDLATIANVATALTVITGVGFGLVEAQRSRRARQERAAFTAVQAILTPEWMKSMVLVHSIPDGSSASAIEADGRVLDAAHVVGVILEGLGYSVYARIVPLRVVADLVGGTVRLAWRKLRPYVEHERQRSGSQKTFEWFQWLAAQLERYSPGETNLQMGAHEAYRDWRP
jgi:hypothetical protein